MQALGKGSESTGEVETTDVVELGVLNELPDLRALEMVNVVEVGGSKVGDQAPVVAGDDGTAPAGGGVGVDAVLDPQADLLDGIAEDVSVLVVADTTKVDDAVRREYVGSSTGGVLGGTTSNQLGIVVV